MSRHVVIGTAGHVDHGKTALVEALTGVDTDRWAEEKRRGITIDLGFAPLALRDGVAASVVDVPGHEDFVRNMVAGATGVDVALLVVAADEGVMPQTTEHLAILEFLGVSCGVVALTKVDLVGAEWLELVEDDLRERLARSSVHWDAIVRTSTVTGEGLDQVRAALGAAAVGAAERDQHDLFRMPIDRVFSVAGAGTVVTGTTWSGGLAVGDAVRVLPGGGAARVRGIEVHGVQQERAEPGRRTALALAGLDRAAAERGHTVVAAEGPWRETGAIDVSVAVLPGARPLGPRSRVRVHLGTAEVLARVTPAEGPVAPGASGVVRLRLEAPLVARWGDRGVLRAYSPVTTVAGFRVVDPCPPARPRRPVDGAALASADPSTRLAALVAREAGHGVPFHDLPVRLGISREVTDRAVGVASGGFAVADGRLFPAARFDEARRTMREALARHHVAAPLEPGLSLEELRATVRPAALARLAERALVDDGSVILERAVARLASHEARLPARLEATAAGVRSELRTSRFEGGTPEELAGRVDGIDSKEARELLEFLVRQGTARRIGPARYFDAAVADQMIATALEVLRGGGELGPAQLRDRLGLTRKYTIPFLEWLDQEGFSVRVGDVRRAGPRA